VVSALVEAGADVDDIQAAVSLDAAFALLEKPSEPALAQPEVAVEAEPDSPSAAEKDQ